MRAHILYAGAAVLLLSASTALAQNATIQASANITQVLTLTINDANLDCGNVLLTAPTVCTTPTNAQVRVVSNADWNLTLEDLGGSANNTISLAAPTGRNGHFILNVSMSSTGGNATPGVDVNVIPGTFQTGTNAQAIDASDDYGLYYGEALITLAAN